MLVAPHGLRENHSTPHQTFTSPARGPWTHSGVTSGHLYPAQPSPASLSLLTLRPPTHPPLVLRAPSPYRPVLGLAVPLHKALPEHFHQKPSLAPTESRRTGASILAVTTCSAPFELLLASFSWVRGRGRLLFISALMIPLVTKDPAQWALRHHDAAPC